jgi:hypothetical protein
MKGEKDMSFIYLYTYRGKVFTFFESAPMNEQTYNTNDYVIINILTPTILSVTNNAKDLNTTIIASDGINNFAAHPGDPLVKTDLGGVMCIYNIYAVDSLGLPTAWNIVIASDPNATHTIKSANSASATVSDAGYTIYANAHNLGSPGVWSVTKVKIATVLEPPRLSVTSFSLP